MQTITVEMPVEYLLQVAVAGKMGDGELLTLMKVWAEKECVRHGLEQNYLNLVDKRLNEMRARLANVVGKNAMNYIDEAITKTVRVLRKDNHE